MFLDLFLVFVLLAARLLGLVEDLETALHEGGCTLVLLADAGDVAVEILQEDAELVAALGVLEVRNHLLLMLECVLELVDLLVLLFDSVVALLHLLLQVVDLALQVQLMVLKAHLVRMHQLLHLHLTLSDLLFNFVVLFKKDQI
jgi:hypothetical protein